MKKIYVLGDSISIQYGPYLEKYLQGFMAYSRKEAADQPLQTSADTTMAANNGGDSSNVLATLQYKFDSGGIDADIILFNCGLHDIKTNIVTGKKQVLIDEYEKNLAQIISVIGMLKLNPVWMRTTPCNDDVHNNRKISFHRFSADCKEYNTVADRVMFQHKVPIIDLYGFTKNLGEDIYCDHVHLHEHIREKQGAFLAGWLIARFGVLKE